MKIFLSAILFLVCLGCASTVKYQTHMELQYGMPKAQVLTVLGKPAQMQIYKKMDETIVEYLFYNHFQSYEEQTPICFIDNKVVGWGRTYYQDHVAVEDKRIK